MTGNKKENSNMPTEWGENEKMESARFLQSNNENEKEKANVNEEVITSCNDIELYGIDRFVVSSNAGNEATREVTEGPSNE